ncbi:BglG family transcription antiterminator [Microbacterium sp. JB110]|uniref:BglG family transcription antiterminator n=1 Tax=Microbacterium sp. JB110 TaxID=2024477 RepID=UPI00097EE678|nr:PTS sugar transporter subunit IIA [Microbacterium sp. JB110]SJM65366.1 PRD/PTS system IIA 2 domain protein [Frigoribacterium sp. JB110]
MTAERQEQVLGILLRRAGWVTAADLADRLGVTARSVRSYITAINALAPAGDAIESGPHGYRAMPSAAAVRDELAGAQHGAPRERVRGIIRRLMGAPEGIDVFDTAMSLHVSDATVEADLRRVRGMLTDSELTLQRDDGMVALAGTERSLRRFLTRVVLDDLDERVFDTEALERAADAMGVPAPGLAEFRAGLIARLSGLGFAVNEVAAAEVMLRAAIAVERTRRGRSTPEADDDGGPDRVRVGEVLDELAARHLGSHLTPADRRHLAGVALVSLVEPGESSDEPERRVAEAVSVALRRAAATYGIDLSEEDFVRGFAQHVHNVVQRSHEHVGSRNPMTRAVKLASPLVFEIAVSVAGDLADELGVAIPDDEIADMAMRIGSLVGAEPDAGDVLTAVLVCPGFEGMRNRLQVHLERALGHELAITRVETGYAQDWAGIDADLVLSTIDPSSTGDDRIVRIQPFLTSRDIARVADAAQRVRRQRQLRGLRSQMRPWFAPTAFIRNARAAAPEAMIRLLGDALMREGVIDEEYVASAIEREARSSTAFTESLAVPHAMTMSAVRTAIAVAVNEQSIDWGAERVHVVALVAFSETDRAAFQTVFEQFVDVFADPDNAARIVRRGDTLEAFLDEIAALIDAPA